MRLCLLRTAHSSRLTRLNCIRYVHKKCNVCFLQVPQGLGAAAAARSFLTVFATVWAGTEKTAQAVKITPHIY